MIIFLLIFIIIIIFYFYITKEHFYEESNDEITEQIKKYFLITCCLHRYTKPDKWNYTPLVDKNDTLIQNKISDIVSSDCKNYLKEKWEAIEILYEQCKSHKIMSEWMNDYNNLNELQLTNIISLHTNQDDKSVLLSNDNTSDDFISGRNIKIKIDSKCTVTKNNNIN